MGVVYLHCRLSGYGGINVGLPPASPSEGDLMVTVSFTVDGMLVYKLLKYSQCILLLSSQDKPLSLSEVCFSCGSIMQKLS